MFKTGDKVKTIIHTSGFLRMDLRGEVVAVLDEHKGMKNDFIKVQFMRYNQYWTDIFFASAWEKDE